MSELTEFDKCDGGWPGSRAVRAPGTSFPDHVDSVLSITVPGKSFFYSYSVCLSAGPTLPGLENHETRGTRRSSSDDDLVFFTNTPFRLRVPPTRTE